jgi:tetratricopeptide (TPR) repeat protein
MRPLVSKLLVGLGLSLLGLSVRSSAQNDPAAAIDFPNSGRAAAQKDFREGVFLLHSFEYNDAREAFWKAQKADPGFALAYWGEAMTHNQPIWFTQDRDMARSALARLAPTAAARRQMAPTPVEKGYLDAVEILYGDGDKQSRDRAYADAMRRLSERFPNDVEAASLYALAILGTSHGGRDFTIYMRAAAILEKLFAKSSRHPGVLHYLIHCYDDPQHAKLGLAAARIYAQIAPAAPHVLHMPSHIFLPLGMWDEVASSNEAAWRASDLRMKRKGLAIELRDYHSLWWLQYAYLQMGRYAEARKLLASIEEIAARNDSARVRWHLAFMRAAQIIETREWMIAAEVKVAPAGLARVAAANDLFASAFAALKLGNVAGVETIFSDGGGPAPAAGAEHGEHERGDEAIVDAIEKELKALIRMAKGDTAGAVALMKEAAGIEIQMSFEFGPPMPVKPSNELFGEMLLELKRPADARKQFELSLARTPKRALSLLGLARAAERSGDHVSAVKAYRELLEVWKRADPGLSELAEARRAVARR